MVWAWLADGLDGEERAKLAEEIYAPLEGWERTEQRFWARLNAAAEREAG